MDVVSHCSMPAWGFVWQFHTGMYFQTIVVKATFSLAPGTSTLAPDQESLNDEDSHWDDDETRSIAVPSDKVPFKLRADVLLVGHAYAPNKQPMRSVMTRLTVGEIDKSIEVYCDRNFSIRDGQLREGARFLKMPLRWEKAAGGPDTNNPVGMRFDAPPDTNGAVAVPNLQPPTVVVSQRTDTFAPVGYGPIAPNWPTRMERLRHLAGTSAYRDWEKKPLPQELGHGFFQSAPLDQQVAELRANERIVLENLHPEYPRLVTNLPNLRPKAIAHRATGEREDVKLVADTLWIDTDRGIGVLVWRGGIGLRHAAEPGQVIVTMEDVAASAAVANKATEEFVQPIATVSITENSSSVEDLAGMTLVPGFDLSKAVGNVMPFIGGGATPNAQSKPRTADAALPYGGSSNLPTPPPIVTAPPRVDPIAPPISNTPWAPGDAPGLPRPTPMSIGQIMAATPNVDAPARGSEKPALAGPALSAESNEKPAVIQDAAMGGALAASNAAAESASRASAKALTGRISVDLIWLNAGSMPRIRKQSAWKEILAGVKVRPEDEDLDDDLPPGRRISAKDRREAMAILCRGEPLDVLGVEEALVRATEDENGFTPPLVLAAGELVMRFDELETLKATLVALAPHAHGDKRLEDAIARVQEMFKMPWAQGANAVLEETTANLRKLFVEGRKGAPMDVFDAQVEQTLLEHRHYRKRTVFGQPRVVGTLSTPGAKVGLPVYLPESLAKELPGLRRMGVRLIGEVRPRAEQGEMSAVAVRAVAVGRSLSS